MVSVEKRSRDGQVRWYARYRDDTGKQRVKVFDKQRDAADYLTTVGAALLTNSYVDPRSGAVTVESFFTAWSARQVWVPGTRRAMELAMRSTTFKSVRLRDVRKSHVETWVKSMQAGGLAPGTIRTRFHNVRSLFRAAVDDRLIASDPSVGVKLPRAVAADKSMTIPTPEQVGTLLQAADDYFRPFVALCAFAGLRLGEAAAVQVGDVQFLARQLTVRRQVQRAGGKEVEIRAPKRESVRTIYMPDALLELLSEHLVARALDAVEEPAAWLFLGDNHNPPHQNTVGYWWKRTKQRAGLEFRLHDLRHFFASGLIAEGCDVVTVQRALGHKQPTVTLNTYSHLWPTAEDRTRAAAARMMTSASLDLTASSETGARR